MSQTQRGIVRTALRPNKKIVYLPGVTIRQRGSHTAVLSGAGGKFEMTTSKAKAGDAFYLSSVRKSGYELADNRTIGRAFTYSSKVPIEIVMINTREKEEDVRRISDNSYRRAEKTYKQRISKLEKQLSEKTISEASYHEQLQDLQTWFEKYESLINSMAERYASTDYATIDSLNAAINIAIENGELERADSLISTAGSLEKMVKENKEAERKANERLNIGRDIMENATADLTSIKNDKNRLADLLYSKYSICLTRAERDSAAYYIKMRAELDTTNMNWQLEAGLFIADYLADYEKAMVLYKRALYSAVKQLGDKHPDVATSYNNIGLVYNDQGNYVKALESYNKALEIYLSVFGDKHPNVATSYNNIAAVYFSQGNYAQALEYYNKALELYLSVFGDRHPSVATNYNNIGGVYDSQGNYAKALEYYNKALEIRLSVFGDRHPSVATNYNNIGSVYDSQGNYAKALEYYNKALEIRLSVFGDRHPDIATCYNNIGGIYRGNYAKALEYYNKALKILLSIFGDRHPNVATSYNNIAAVYFSQGNYAQALEYYNKALEIYLSVFGDRHPNVATNYNNIGAVYFSQGNYAQALEYYNKALEIYLSIFRDRHPDVARSCYNIGAVYYNKGNYDQALEYYNKALEIYLSIFGDRHSYVAMSYNNIGGVYSDLKNYDQALEYYDKALEIYLSIFGENHLDVFTCYSNIGITYYMQELYSEAKTNLLKAVEIGKTFLNADDVNIQTLLSFLYRSLIKSSSLESNEYSSFTSDKAFTAMVVSDETPAYQQGMSGEYYLLEFADWNHKSPTDLFDKNNELKDKSKDIVVMKDGVITKHHFENKIGMQLGLKFVSKEEKQKITEAYNKWKKEQKNEK
ncbi:DUF2225 domain-containing protein [Prevotella sp. HCN-7019]|uniref:DUF2225 domain-containing protein n=1 Tax=Prevotella sp. HCN-7019 TaxID=3134668 RepID=UPI0030BD8C6A